MTNFKTINKTIIKSTNHTKTIFKRYTYTLIIFLLFAIIYNLITKNFNISLTITKNFIISIITALLIQYIINLIKKKKTTIRGFKEQFILPITIILALVATNCNIVILIIATIVSIVILNVFKNINLSSAIYGVLIITVYCLLTKDLLLPLTNLRNVGYINTYNLVVGSSFIPYLLGSKENYISPILAIITFIYLFHKKSTKYNIIFSFLITFGLIMLFIGIFNHMNIWYVIFELLTGNLLFLTIYCLSDYTATPTSGEGQVLYGTILGLLTAILRFIIPELSIIISIIIGELLLTKWLEKISFKLKYNRKFYYFLISTLIFLSILFIIITSIII